KRHFPDISFPCQTKFAGRTSCAGGVPPSMKITESRISRATPIRACPSGVPNRGDVSYTARCGRGVDDCYNGLTFQTENEIGTRFLCRERLHAFLRGGEPNN